MAKGKGGEKRPYARVKTKEGWTRTAAGWGSDAFEKATEFQEGGCGVRGPIKRVSVDPNRDISLGHQEGLHHGGVHPQKAGDGSEAFKDIGD